MIVLTHSEAFCYDLLAIAAIKVAHNTDSVVDKENLLILDEQIQAQVGVLRHEQVCASEEYRNLYRVNDEMYVRIDELKSRGEQLGDAVYIDNRVYARYLAKKALQEKWFGTSLTETKHGYKV